MNSRTVMIGESAENINLKKEIEFLSKIIKNHQAQQLRRLPKHAQFKSSKVSVARSSPGAIKSWNHQMRYPSSMSTRLTLSHVKKYSSQTRFTKGSQIQQPSKYKLVKSQPASPGKISPVKTNVLKPQTGVTKGVHGSIQPSSYQTPTFFKTQKKKYKVVNKSMTPKRTFIQRTPPIFAYVRPNNSVVRQFNRFQKYPFSSAFVHPVQFRWNVANRIKFVRRLHLQPARQYQLKTPKKNTSGNNCHVVSIGGLWYRASQTKLSRTTTPVNKKGSYTSGSPRMITVMGVKYQMNSNRTTLRRITPKGGGSPVSNKMSRIDLGGHTYVKNNAGVFVKTPTTEKRIFASRAVSRSIYHIQRSHQRKAWRKNNQQCMFYVRFGKCHKEAQCQYVHDPDKIAVCTRFLRGTCKVSQCPFSHKISPDKMPVCSYFLQGRCSSDNCPYRHVKVNPSAEICKNFLKGHCPQGTQCKERHVMDCPQKGACTKKDCPFRHRKRKLPPSDSQKNENKRKPPSVVARPAAAQLKPLVCERSQDVGSSPSFIALPSISPDIKEECQGGSGKSELQIRPRFLKLS